MTPKTLSAQEVRVTLVKHILAKQENEVLGGLLKTKNPDTDLLVKADEEIINHLLKHSSPVYGKGRRFFLPISAKFGKPEIGEELVYSESAGERAGQHMKRDGAVFGIKFYNGIDKIEQAVVGNGEGVIVIGGEMTDEKAGLLQDKLDKLTDGTGDPEKLTLENVKDFLEYAKELGLTDIWNSRKSKVLSFVANDGREMQEGGELKQYAGYFKNEPKPGKGHAAVYIQGGTKFEGNVAGGMQDYSAGDGFFITIGVRDGKSQYRGIEEAAFRRDYEHEDKTSATESRLFNIKAANKEVKPSLLSRIRALRNHPRIAHIPETLQQRGR